MIDKLQREFHERIRVFVIYVQEAHPPGSPQPYHARLTIQIPAACSIADRRKAARILADHEKLSTDILLDTMKNEAAIAYAANPTRLYVIDAAGRVAYRGGGPTESTGEAVPILHHLLGPSGPNYSRHNCHPLRGGWASGRRLDSLLESALATFHG